MVTAPKTKFSDGTPLTVAQRYLERALDWYGKKKYALALADLDEAIKAERRNPELYATRGLILMETGADEEAKADLAAALKADPSQWVAHYAYAMGDLRAGHYDAALQHLATALRYSPLRPEIYLYQAAVYHAKGDKKGADTAIDSVLQILQPDNPLTKIARKWKQTIKKMS